MSYQYVLHTIPHLVEIKPGWLSAQGEPAQQVWATYEDIPATSAPNITTKPLWPPAGGSRSKSARSSRPGKSCRPARATRTKRRLDQAQSQSSLSYSAKCTRIMRPPVISGSCASHSKIGGC